MQKQKLKQKKSLAVAMCGLIAAARSQKDVLLLNAADACADRAMQEYNDCHADSEFDPDYRRFLDGLAQQFHLEHHRGTAFAPSLPSPEQLEEADWLITRILEK